MKTLFLRKLRSAGELRNQHVFKSYESEAEAVSDTLPRLDLEVLRANVESLGENTKVLVPTRVLQPKSCAETPRARYEDDETEDL
jgi:hypothetical protein